MEQKLYFKNDNFKNYFCVKIWKRKTLVRVTRTKGSLYIIGFPSSEICDNAATYLRFCSKQRGSAARHKISSM